MKNRKSNKPADLRDTEVLHEQIGLRAYYIWLASGGGHGNGLLHWLEAEKEIATRASASMANPQKGPGAL